MADKNKSEKHVEKGNKAKQNFLQKIGSIVVKTLKKLKNFFISLKAELKRVVWPDKKRLIQNTATVLAICIIASLILFVVDSALGSFLEGVGFYSPSAATATTTAATAVTSTSDTTAVTTATTTVSSTTASK